VTMHRPINIYSGTKGLGGALTNPTELSQRKGSIKHKYPVELRGIWYADAEEAYQDLKSPNFDFDKDRRTMVEILTAKLHQHPQLKDAIADRGGLAWLRRCRHVVRHRDGEPDRWEGEGLRSPFVRCLYEAYAKFATLDEKILVVNGKVDGWTGAGKIYIGRENVRLGLAASPLHNPFRIGEDGSRDEVVAKYHRHLKGRILDGDRPTLYLLRMILEMAKDNVPVELCCYCKPAKCHGDVVKAALLWMANGGLERELATSRNREETRETDG